MSPYLSYSLTAEQLIMEAFFLLFLTAGRQMRGTGGGGEEEGKRARRYGVKTTVQILILILTLLPPHWAHMGHA